MKNSLVARVVSGMKLKAQTLPSYCVDVELVSRQLRKRHNLKAFIRVSDKEERCASADYLNLSLWKVVGIGSWEPDDQKELLLEPGKNGTVV
jgi:hypothetical protein